MLRSTPVGLGAVRVTHRFGTNAGQFYYRHAGNGASHREELAAGADSTCNALIFIIKTSRRTSVVVTLEDLLVITYLNGDKDPVFCTPCGG